MHIQSHKDLTLISVNKQFYYCHTCSYLVNKQSGLLYNDSG